MLDVDIFMQYTYSQRLITRNSNKQTTRRTQLYCLWHFEDAANNFKTIMPNFFRILYARNYWKNRPSCLSVRPYCWVSNRSAFGKGTSKTMSILMAPFTLTAPGVRFSAPACRVRRIAVLW